ncbi:MAG: sulfite exporter TauE/SafE family protein [Pseudomonadota bacterium]
MTAVEPLLALAVAAIFLAGGIVKGALGFGLPLVTIAVLPFLVPVEAAIGLNALVLVVVNALQAWRYWVPGAIWRLAAPVIAGLVVAIPVGVALASAIPPRALLGLLGLFVMGFALYGLAQAWRAGRAPEGATDGATDGAADGAPDGATTTAGAGAAAGAAAGAGAGPAVRAPRAGAGFATGIAGGVVGALTSAPGPIFVMYFTALRLERAAFMGVLGLVMGLVGVVLLGSLAVAGAPVGQNGVLALAAVPPAFAGFWTGGRLGARFSIQGFRIAVLSLLTVLGSIMLYRAIG